MTHELSYILNSIVISYFFQYATRSRRQKAIAQKVTSGDAQATGRYLSFLGGGSKDQIDLLKDAGVDMTTTAADVDP